MAAGSVTSTSVPTTPDLPATAASAGAAGSWRPSSRVIVPPAGARDSASMARTKPSMVRDSAAGAAQLYGSVVSEERSAIGTASSSAPTSRRISPPDSNAEDRSFASAESAPVGEAAKPIRTSYSTAGDVAVRISCRRVG